MTVRLRTSPVRLTTGCLHKNHQPPFRACLAPKTPVHHKDLYAGWEHQLWQFHTDEIQRTSLFFPEALKLSQWSAVTAPPGSSCHSLKAGSKNMGGQRKGGKQNRQGTDNSRKKQKRRGAAIRLGVQIILVLWSPAALWWMIWLF